MLAGTGTGKTFIIADLMRMLWDIQWHEGKTFSHIPLLYVTKNTILEQTNRVFKKWYNLKPNIDFDVINIEMLRSTAGQYWVKEEKYIERGNIS